MLHVALYDKLSADVAEIHVNDLADELNQGMQLFA